VPFLRRKFFGASLTALAASQTAKFDGRRVLAVVGCAGFFLRFSRGKIDDMLREFIQIARAFA